ncbi:MAG: nuclear transport factor 2 family protein [Dehalococcoidia bacterium]
MPQSKLVEIEEIKKLKARYFRLMDKKLWDEWGEVFTDDATLQYGPNPADVFEGREGIVEGLSNILADAVTVHHGHMPEIEIIDDSTARGAWAMFDYIEMTGLILKGYGHYEEEYVKENGRWKIKNLRLTRLRVDTTRTGENSQWKS